jgi:glycolate oxidase FAD binding subunit
MAVSTATLGQALASIVGAPAVRSGGDLAPVDAVIPRWSAAPGSVDELGRVMALARAERLAVVPRGSGGAMSLGHPLRRADVLLDLSRMSGILEYNPDDLTVTVQAGMALEDLNARLHRRSQFLPLDPAMGARRTLGGIAATAASGPLRLRYGTMRDLLLGVRFVQADGVVTWGGAKVVKSVTGYDVPKLMVGALGTLGVLAELTLRLHPLPAGEGTWLASFPSDEAAQDFVAALVDSPLQPSRVEWLNPVAARPWGGGAAAASVAVSLGSIAAAVRDQAERLEGLARRAGGLWRSADAHLWAHHGAADPARRDLVSLRIATLASEVARTARDLDDALAVSAASGFAAVSGCAPLGVLRAHVAGIGAREGSMLVSRLRESLARVGGAVVIERAPVALRAAVDPWGPVEPQALALMRAVKQQFDPDGVLNPGRFVGGL